MQCIMQFQYLILFTIFSHRYIDHIESMCIALPNPELCVPLTANTVNTRKIRIVSRELQLYIIATTCSLLFGRQILNICTCLYTQVSNYNILYFVVKFEILVGDLWGARVFNSSQGSVAICFGVVVI